jgi:nucleotidyltransferase/DNA polymerase involved in DNA repair
MAPRTILHVDMDAFYAAVEQRDRPELRGKPVIVGADPKGGRGRGVVSTASYEARRFGVASAMPISEAFRRCPKGIYLQPDMERYVRESSRIMAILERFSDRVEPVSIDEAFLDATGSERALGSGETIGRNLKQAIRDETLLSASVGVASSKLVAKVASDVRKPDGLTVVAPGTEAAFLAPLPVRRLWGVGPKMEETLAKLGVTTIGELAALDAPRLARKIGTHCSGSPVARTTATWRGSPPATRPWARSTPTTRTPPIPGACAPRCCSSPTASRRACALMRLRRARSRSSTATRTSAPPRTRAR